MDDRFLAEPRREPRPEFARSLRERLRTGDAGAPRPAFRLHPALAAGLAAAAFAASFALPAVRATAQQVLDLFRVREFAVVQVDENRLAKLKEHRFDPAALLGSSVERLQDPGEPRRFADVSAAERAAGFPVRRPAFLAPLLRPDSVFLRGESRTRFTVDVKPLREMMDLMDVRDLDVPAGLDGRTIEARMPAVVVQTYRSDGRRRGAFVQAESPEVSLPPGVDLAVLGEIGLRLVGVEANEARRLARTIDWRGTMLVPVVGTATRFQQVSVGGAHGLMLETDRMETPEGGSRGPGHVLMWTKDGRVYAMMGNFESVDLVQMAESVR
jgi:hypothetical protein